MPLPTPKKDEEQDDFISRCMSNKQAREDFPDNDQRLAVCFGRWRDKKEKKEMPNEKETRTFTFKLEARDDENPLISGHAAVFNEEADIGFFKEKIKRGAFAESIQVDDVRALFNHDPNHVLGRNKAGTLKLQEDRKGLAIEIVPPDTQFARDLLISVKRGDISQMSFGFQVQEDSWKHGEDGAPDVRTLKKVRLFDVSPVTFPAYVGTDVAVRSHDIWQKKNNEISASPDKLSRKLKIKLRKEEV